MKLRIARPSDAEQFLALKRRLDKETSFMLIEPAERSEDVATVEAELRRIAESDNSVIILAENEGVLSGYVELAGGSYRRNRLTAEVVIGVLEGSSGKGLGAELLRHAERWAREHELHRLELTVMTTNARAIALYERSGFRHEGRRRECLILDGELRDELRMAKLLYSR